jgi:hypothetical protein
MSKSKQNNNKKPLKGSSPEGIQPKVLIIWAGILVTILSLYFLTGPSRKQNLQTWKIKDVMQAVQNGWVEKGTIKNEPRGGGLFRKLLSILITYPKAEIIRKQLEAALLKVI